MRLSTPDTGRIDGGNKSTVLILLAISLVTRWSP